MPLQIDEDVARSEHEAGISFAEHAALRSNCIRRSVGAVLMKDGLVISSGWNGVAGKYTDCREAGCPRCIGGGETGSGYENCICIHAEQQAIADAARKGLNTEGSWMYVTLRPCLQCLAISIAAGVKGVCYSGELWKYPAEVEKVYQVLSNQFEMFERIGEQTPSVTSPIFRLIGRLIKPKPSRRAV